MQYITMKMTSVQSFLFCRCCRKNLNSSCFAITDVHGRPDRLPDGTPCYQGFCNMGKCERTMQDVVERIWDFIDDFNINSVLKFLKDNIVGAIVVISLLFWVPISCLISYVDRKRAEKVCRSKLAPYCAPYARYTVLLSLKAT